MILIKNNQRTYALPVTSIKRAVQKMLKTLEYPGFDVAIIFTSMPTIKRYNALYRNKNKATDILSFPYHSTLAPGERIIPQTSEDKNLGDIIIAPEYVARTYQQWNRSFQEHLIALLAHGLAHLLNYDHITDEEYRIMQKVEKRLLTAALGKII